MPDFLENTRNSRDDDPIERTDRETGTCDSGEWPDATYGWPNQKLPGLPAKAARIRGGSDGDTENGAGADDGIGTGPTGLEAGDLLLRSRRPQDLIRSFRGSYQGASCALAGTRSQATSTSRSWASSHAWVTPLVAGEIAHAERRADAVAVHARGDRADDPSAGPDRLLVVEQLAVVQQPELDQAAGRRARPRAAQQRLAADEPARLVPGDAEAQAGFERVVLVGRCRGPSGGSPSRCGRRSSRDSRHGEAEFLARLDDPVEDVGGEFGRDVELPAQLADIGDPAGADPGIADLDLARGGRRGRPRWRGPRPRAWPAARAISAPSGRSIGRPEVMSATRSGPRPGCVGCSQAKSRVWTAAPVTTRKLVSARRVTVRSASMPPCSLHHWV